MLNLKLILTLQIFILICYFYIQIYLDIFDSGFNEIENIILLSFKKASMYHNLS